MDTIEQRACGSCGEPLYWLKHERTGKSAPIEQKCTDHGNVEINLMRGTYRIVPKEERAAYLGWMHLNHFAECPQAPIWAKAGRSA